VSLTLKGLRLAQTLHSPVPHNITTNSDYFAITAVISWSLNMKAHTVLCEVRTKSLCRKANFRLHVHN